ncbi:MAG: hypothetical protein PHW86_07840, partial [Candidatus Bipolaricaulis sp.]|nr:hypothetical protein [Candidatus Bipolaricaulis sp.]
LPRARRLIDGNDLIRLGMPPGPRLGEILEFLQDRVLAGEIAARSMALHEAETLIRRALDETQAPRQRDTRPRSPDAPSLL